MSDFQILKEVFVINLDRRPDRWEKVSRRLAQHLPSDRFKATRVSAIDGSDPENNLSPAQALTATFLRLFDTLLSQNCNANKNRSNTWVVILEDDVLVHKRFEYFFTCLEEKLKSMSPEERPPFVYMGTNEPNPPKDDNWLKTQRECNKLEFTEPQHVTHGAFAIMYNVDAIEKLLSGIVRSKSMELPFDNILNRHVTHKITTIPCSSPLVCRPNLMIADVSDSDIRGKRHQKTFAQQRHWDLMSYDNH